MSDLRVFILADDPLVRAGLALLLEGQAGVMVVGREGVGRMKDEVGRMKAEEVFRYDATLWDLGADPEKALGDLEQARDDLDLVELGPVVWLAPEAAELSLELLAPLLETFSADGMPERTERRLVGRGILRREASADQMVQALHAVSAGLGVWGMEIKDKGEGIRDNEKRINRSHPAEKEQAPNGAVENSTAGYREGVEAFDTAVIETGETLTAREAEVLRLVADGLPNKAIAARLGISEHTVKFHLNIILGKLQASSRTEAVTRAARLGWIIL